MKTHTCNLGFRCFLVLGDAKLKVCDIWSNNLRVYLRLKSIQECNSQRAASKVYYKPVGNFLVWALSNHIMQVFLSNYQYYTCVNPSTFFLKLIVQKNICVIIWYMKKRLIGKPMLFLLYGLTATSAHVVALKPLLFQNSKYFCSESLIWSVWTVQQVIRKTYFDVQVCDFVLYANC